MSEELSNKNLNKKFGIVRQGKAGWVFWFYLKMDYKFLLIVIYLFFAIWFILEKQFFYSLICVLFIFLSFRKEKMKKLKIRDLFEILFK